MIPLLLVIDTNIVVSAALKPAGVQRTVVLLSRPQPKIRKGLQRELIDLITRHARPVSPTRHLQVMQDPDDNLLLECADAARADYLVTDVHPTLRSLLTRPTSTHSTTRILPT